MFRLVRRWRLLEPIGFSLPPGWSSTNKLQSITADFLVGVGPEFAPSSPQQVQVQRLHCLLRSDASGSSSTTGRVNSLSQARRRCLRHSYFFLYQESTSRSRPRQLDEPFHSEWLLEHSQNPPILPSSIKSVYHDILPRSFSNPVIRLAMAPSS